MLILRFWYRSKAWTCFYFLQTNTTIHFNNIQYSIL